MDTGLSRKRIEQLLRELLEEETRGRPYIEVWDIMDDYPETASHVLYDYFKGYRL